jgi:hypothetical protein
MYISRATRTPGTKIRQKFGLLVLQHCNSEADQDGMQLLKHCTEHASGSEILL